MTTNVSAALVGGLVVVLAASCGGLATNGGGGSSDSGDATDGGSTAEASSSDSPAMSNNCQVPDLDGAVIDCPRDGGCQIDCYACPGADAASCVLGHTKCFCEQGGSGWSGYQCSRLPCIAGH